MQAHNASFTLNTKPFYFRAGLLLDIPLLSAQSMAATLEGSVTRGIAIKVSVLYAVSCMLHGTQSHTAIQVLLNHVSFRCIHHTHSSQVSGIITPFRHVHIRDLAVSVSPETGFSASAAGTLAGIDVGFMISQKKPTLGEGQALSFTAATSNSIKLNTLVGTLWPSAPSAVLQLLTPIVFNEMQAAYNSSTNKLSIAALPAVHIPALTDVSDAMDMAFTYSESTLRFAVGEALSDIDFNISVVLDFPLLGLQGTSASLRASAADSELELLVRLIDLAWSCPAALPGV